MSQYKTIRELVIESCVAEGGFPSYEQLTSLVRQHFPTSKWKKTHYAWFKSKIKTGEIAVPGISGGLSERTDDDGIEVEESIEAISSSKPVRPRTMPSGSYWDTWAVYQLPNQSQQLQSGAS